MTSHIDTPLPTRRKLRASTIMVWIFAALAAGVMGVFMIQASGFDTAALLTPAPQSQQTAPASAPTQTSTGKQDQQEERFAVQGSEVAGFDDDRQPYEIAAVEAKQDTESPNLVHMRQVTGLLRRADGRKMDVTAANGTFDSKQKSLSLRGDVTIKLADTFTASMNSAQVDVERKALASNDDVLVLLDDEAGTINSTGINVADNGAQITFLSNVRAVFRSAASDDTTQSDTAQPDDQQNSEQTSAKGNLQQ